MKFNSFDADKAWLNDIQTRLAKRSIRKGTFNQVYHLLKNKRLARMAITSALTNRGARTPGVDGKSKEDYASLKSRFDLIDEIISDIKSKRYKPSPAGNNGL